MRAGVDLSSESEPNAVLSQSLLRNVFPAFSDSLGPPNGGGPYLEGAALPLSDSHRYQALLDGSLVLGGMRLRQIRAAPQSCHSPYSTFQDCISLSKQDENPHPAIEPGQPGRMWTSASDNGDELPWYGKRNTYDGSGYVVDVFDYSNASATLNMLQRAHWLDSYTKALIVDLTTYQPATNLHYVLRLSMEFSDSGGT